MYESITIQTDRTNVVQLGLGFDVSGEVITSQIRAGASLTSGLLATWGVAFATDGTDGELVLTLDNSVLSGITRRYGHMDIKRLVSGEPISVLLSPMRVYFQGVVTA